MKRIATINTLMRKLVIKPIDQLVH